jgi:hypothetical protein
MISRQPDEFSRMRDVSPEITSCNDFIRLFIESEKQSIHVSEHAIANFTPEILSPLQKIPYQKVRNRFRILSNLDPVKNQKEERGIIRVGFTTNEVLTTNEIISIFPPNDESFLLKKTEPNQAPEK